MENRPSFSLPVPVIRCGTDLIGIDRIRKAIERLGLPFLNRVFTAGEQRDCLNGNELTTTAAASLAARFAAKEAVGKALGTGLWRQGVCWTDIEIRRDPDGSPIVELTGGALQVYQSLRGQSLVISLSHESGLALAFCILTCCPPALEGNHA